MDPRLQPHLDHPANAVALTQEARALFASGWHCSRDEGRVVNLADGAERTVTPETWHSLRELVAQVPAQVRDQR